MTPDLSDACDRCGHFYGAHSNRASRNCTECACVEFKLKRWYDVPVDLSKEARDFDEKCAAIGREDLMVNPPRRPKK